MARTEDFKTPLARLAFANSLFKPQENKSGKKSWTCSLLFEKGSDIKPLVKAVEDAAVAEWGEKAKNLLKEGLIKNPILDGDGKQGKNKSTGETHKGFANAWFIRPTSGEDYRPKLFDKKVLPITSQDQLYSGAHVYAVVNAFTWENSEQGKGVSFGLSMVQFARDGERLGGGGGANPEKFLEKIEDDGEGKAGGDASSFFD